MAPAKYKVGDRVKCLATRFDTPGNEDSQGRKWSDIHMQQEKTKWVYGTVMSVRSRVLVRVTPEVRAIAPRLARARADGA